MIKIYGLFLILSGLFIAYHMYIAPMTDENGKIIKEGKKLKDLFKRK
jgi:hypothetical protein